MLEQNLFILKSVIGFELVMLAKICGKLTYFETLTDIRQLWHKRLEYASHTHIKHFAKMVDRISLDDIYLFENNSILEKNQNDGILSNSLPE